MLSYSMGARVEGSGGTAAMCRHVLGFATG